MKIIEIDELRSIQLKILCEIDQFCHDNDIKYYICSGTLIGAVRHKGYIPWDDDIDICMFRTEYNKFFKLFNKNRTDEFKAICIDNYSEYYLVSGKVINTNTIMDEDINIDQKLGVYVDIFQLDDLPNDKRKIDILNNRISVYRNLLALKTITLNKRRSALKNMALSLGNKLVPDNIIPKLIKKINVLSQKYNNMGYELVGDIGNYTYGEGEVLRKEWFDPPVKLTFEGLEFDAPNKFDEVLKRMFGDYMTLPPEEKRQSHHTFAAYWKDNVYEK